MTAGKLYVWYGGPRGRVLVYMRPNGRCPAADFLEEMPSHLAKRFDRMFTRFGEIGMAAADNGAFKPLVKEGKGLWAFKEHDHRLLCFRCADEETPVGRTTVLRQQIILLLGWVKDKDFTVEERKQNERAHAMREECIQTTSLHTVLSHRPPKSKIAILREDLNEPLFTPEYHAAIASMVPVLDATTAGVAAKGPAQPPPKGVAPTPPMDPLPKPEPPKPLPQEEPLEPKSTKPVTLPQLAKLANVPYKWLWLMIKEGRVPNGTVAEGTTTRVWSWDGIDKVVAGIEELRRTGIPGQKREQPTPLLPSPIPLLTLMQAARVVKVSKGEMRRAVNAKAIPVAEVRSGARLFRHEDVQRWWNNHHGPKPNGTVAEGTTTRVWSWDGIDKVVQSKVRSKVEMRMWLDGLLAGTRSDVVEFTEAIRAHLEYRKQLEEQLRALGEG